MEVFMELLIGIAFLILFMFAVMGAPCAYFLTRDARYAASKHLPEDKRLQIWYGGE